MLWPGLLIVFYVRKFFLRASLNPSYWKEALSYCLEQFVGCLLAIQVEGSSHVWDVSAAAVQSGVQGESDIEKWHGVEGKDEDRAFSQGDGEALETSGNMVAWVLGMKSSKGQQ